MKTYRLLAFIVSLLMLSSVITGCGPKASSDSTTGKVEESVASGTTAAIEAADPKLDKSEYYEVVLYMDVYDPKSEELAANNSFRKLLKDKFNFGYKQVPNPGDSQEKIALMLSAGDYPDMLRLYSQENIQVYAKAGALLDLKPLIDKYGPDFKKTHEKDFPIYENGSGMGDGKIYFYTFNEPSETLGVSQPFLEWEVRSDILKQQGYPNIANEKDLIQVLKKGLTDNPKTGNKKTVGIGYPMNSFGMTSRLILGYQYNLGRLHHITGNIAATVYDFNQKKFIDSVSDYSFMESLRFFNLAYREGILDKESITDDYDTYVKKMKEGVPLANFFMTWERDSFNDTLKKNGADYRYVPVPIMLSAQLEKGESKTYCAPSVNIQTSVSITKNAKYPERIMEVLNYQATEEGLVRAGWGEEGVQYTVVDGKRVPTAEYYEKSANDPNYKYSFNADQQFGFFNGLDSKGQILNIALDTDVLARLSDPIIKDTMKAYGWNNIHDMYFNNKNFKFDYGKSVDLKGVAPVLNEEQTKRVEKLAASVDEYIVPLVTAKDNAEFDKKYNEMLKKRKDLGIDELVDLVNANYTALCEKYGIKN